MLAYHLDRSEKLKEGYELHLLDTSANLDDQIVELYGFNKVSHWGKLCYEYLLNPFTFTDINSMNSFQIDLQAEIIRKQFYSNMPSRFKSIFAVKQISDFIPWAKYFSINQCPHIFEIECDASQCIELDATYLKGGITCNPNSQIESLHKYWSGQLSNSPLLELLIPLPVTIGRSIRSEELIF